MKCAGCHGPTGKEGPSDVLVGGQNSLATSKPLKTIGSYLPGEETVTIKAFLHHRILKYNVCFILKQEGPHATTQGQNRDRHG